MRRPADVILDRSLNSLNALLKQLHHFSNARMDDNILMRHDKGISISNQILSILTEVSFGVYHFEMGMLFRTAMLINGILFNTEAMESISEQQISSLEECDRYLL